MKPQEKKSLRAQKRKLAKEKAARKKDKGSRPDPRRPQRIEINPYHNPDELCGFDRCEHGVRFVILYKHMFRGRMKRARRTRCKGHANFFAFKHDFEWKAA